MYAEETKFDGTLRKLDSLIMPLAMHDVSTDDEQNTSMQSRSLPESLVS